MNFDKQFKEYHGVVKLSPSKKKELIGDGTKKGSRDALRDRIKKSFKDNERKQPKFYMQGSFSMTTTINPISAEYDLDDGVYLQNIDTSKPMDEWEKPEKVHKWIMDAIDDHTSKDTTDKNLCVRVNYADEKKHIDLPIYVTKDDTYYLAVRNSGWIESNPKEISDWFVDEVKSKGEQYRRIVRYLKGWKDFRENRNSSIKLFGGFQLTVLTSYHFVEDLGSDEESFFKTAQEINNNLWKYRYEIAHPKNDKNIIEHYIDRRKEIFQDEFKAMFEKAKKAYEENDCVEKSKKWEKVFGDRFPQLSSEDCEKDKNTKESAAIITGTTNIANTSGRQA
jgi:hypothetical protein